MATYPQDTSGEWKRTGQHTWNSVDYTWSNIPYKWSDVPIFIKIDAGGSGGGASIARKKRRLANYEDLKKKEQERIIELICTVRGVRYVERKSIKEIEVTAEDIDFLMENFIKNISIDIKVKE